MDNEGKGRGEKGDKDMQTILRENKFSFADFVKANKSSIRKAVESNSKKNNNGFTVISKNDSWRNELEWDEIDKASFVRGLFS